MSGHVKTNYNPGFKKTAETTQRGKLIRDQPKIGVPVYEWSCNRRVLLCTSGQMVRPTFSLQRSCTCFTAQGSPIKHGHADPQYILKAGEIINTALYAAIGRPFHATEQAALVKWNSTVFYRMQNYCYLNTTVSSIIVKVPTIIAARYNSSSLKLWLKTTLTVSVAWECAAVSTSGTHRVVRCGRQHEHKTQPHLSTAFRLPWDA